MTTVEPQRWANRLEKLERENKRFREAATLLLLFMIVLFALGAAHPGKHSVTATEFLLQDEQGNTRARLSVDSKQRVALTFLDQTGREQLSLSSINDTKGHGHASLALGEGAVYARLALAASHPDEYAMISDGGLFLAGQDTTRIVISASGPRSPSLEIADSRGYATQLGVSSVTHDKSGGSQQSSAASIVLVGKDREVLWSAPAE
jgi:hypothetical protein